MAKTKIEKIAGIEEEIRQLENKRRQLVQAQKAQVKLRPDHKLALLREMDLPQRVKAARDLLASLARLVRRARAA